MTHRSPSYRWTKEHGQKLIHDRLRHAWFHAAMITIKCWRQVRRDRKPWLPYPCRWGDWYQDGQTAPRHWHVGRSGKYTERRGTR